jgi:TolB-like protein/tetratricopeptide (TPR) repeat protein
LFWADLKRRKVIQVAIAYAIVAWLVIQIVVAIEAPLSLPPWTDTLVIVLLAIGFPVALVVSWMFDLTPEGLKRTSEAEGASTTITASPAGSRRLEYVILILFAVAIAWLLYRTEAPREEAPPVAAFPPPPAGAPPGAGPGLGGAPAVPGTPTIAAQPLPKSVAVLLCENLSPNADDAFFAAGIHEEILNQLAKISDLSVIARTSMLKYAETRQTIAEIARELKVGTIVECSVRYAGQTVRVTAQFIEAATGVHLWSETYDRDRTDIFGIQTDIASKIAASLSAELSGDEQRRLAAVPTASPEAYALYLRGGALFDGTVATVDAARSYVERAIELDPQFALAHARKGLFDVLSLGTIAGGPASEDVGVRAEIAARARDSAEAALALDSSVGVAHAVLGWVLYTEWKWAEAGEAFAHAVELAPSEPSVLAARAAYLLGEGKDAEAVRLLERAVSLDPANPTWHYGLAGGRALAGDFAGAGDAAREGLAMDASYYLLHDFASRLAMVPPGNRPLAETEARTVERLLGPDPAPSEAANLAGLYYEIGLTADAQRLVAYVEAEAARRPVSAQTLAVLYMRTRDLDKAYAWFDTAIRTHDTYGYALHLTMRLRRAFNQDWDDPRYQEVRRDLGLDY